MFSKPNFFSICFLQISLGLKSIFDYFHLVLSLFSKILLVDPDFLLQMTHLIFYSVFDFRLIISHYQNIVNIQQYKNLPLRIWFHKQTWIKIIRFESKFFHHLCELIISFFRTNFETILRFIQFPQIVLSNFITTGDSFWNFDIYIYIYIYICVCVCVYGWFSVKSRDQKINLLKTLRKCSTTYSGNPWIFSDFLNS